MPADTRKLIAGQPFVPFTIHTAGGKLLRVPTVEHIAVPPAGGRIFDFSDDGGYEVFSARLIARLGVEHGEPAPAESARNDQSRRASTLKLWRNFAMLSAGSTPRHCAPGYTTERRPMIDPGFNTALHPTSA